MSNILLKIQLDKEVSHNNSSEMSAIVSELRGLRKELSRAKSTKPSVVVVSSEKRLKAIEKKLSKPVKNNNKALIRELKGIKSRVATKPKIVNVTKNIIRKQTVSAKPNKVLFEKKKAVVKRKKKKKRSVANKPVTQRLVNELKMTPSELSALPFTTHMGGG